MQHSALTVKYFLKKLLVKMKYVCIPISTCLHTLLPYALKYAIFTIKCNIFKVMLFSGGMDCAYITANITMTIKFTPPQTHCYTAYKTLNRSQEFSGYDMTLIRAGPLSKCWCR